jgi:hypothetical protein
MPSPRIVCPWIDMPRLQVWEVTYIPIARTPAKSYVLQGNSEEIYELHHFFDVKKGSGPHFGRAVTSSPVSKASGSRKGRDLCIGRRRLQMP